MMTASASSLAFWLRLSLIGLVLGGLEIYGQFYADPAFMSPPSQIFQAFSARILAEPKIIQALLLCVLQIAAAYGLSVKIGRAHV